MKVNGLFFFPSFDGNTLLLKSLALKTDNHLSHNIHYHLKHLGDAQLGETDTGIKREALF